MDESLQISQYMYSPIHDIQLYPFVSIHLHSSPFVSIHLHSSPLSQTSRYLLLTGPFLPGRDSRKQLTRQTGKPATWQLELHLFRRVGSRGDAETDVPTSLRERIGSNGLSQTYPRPSEYYAPSQEGRKRGQDDYSTSGGTWRRGGEKDKADPPCST